MLIQLNKIHAGATQPLLFLFISNGLFQKTFICQLLHMNYFDMYNTQLRIINESVCNMHVAKGRTLSLVNPPTFYKYSINTVQNV